jgi:hypothetical protein
MISDLVTSLDKGTAGYQASLRLASRPPLSRMRRYRPGKKADDRWRTDNAKGRLFRPTALIEH